MKKVALICLALLAVYMGKRAVRREAEIVRLLWVLLAMVALNSANTPKTRAIEDRLNALVPQVFPNTGGTITGPVTVNADHTINGNAAINGTATVSGNVNGSGGALKNSNGIHSGASVQADGDLIAGGQVLVNGASGSATVEVNGNGHVTSSFQVDGDHTVGGTVSVRGQGLFGGASSSATLAVAGNAHIAGPAQIDGDLNGGPVVVGGQGAVSPITGGTPSGYTTAWASQVGSAVNGIINRLNSSGLC